MNKEENSNRYIEKHIFKTFSKTIYKEPDNKTTRVGKGMHVDFITPRKKRISLKRSR